jgi:hypothetical protein
MARKEGKELEEESGEFYHHRDERATLCSAKTPTPEKHTKVMENFRKAGSGPTRKPYSSFLMDLGRRRGLSQSSHFSSRISLPRLNIDDTRVIL